MGREGSPCRGSGAGVQNRMIGIHLPKRIGTLLTTNIRQSVSLHAGSEYPSGSPKAAGHQLRRRHHQPPGRGRSDHRLAAGLAVRKRRQSHSRSPAVQQASDLHRRAAGQGSQVPCNLLSCKHSESTFEDRNWRFTCGNVELSGVEPLASCMPCNKSNAPAWASIASTWTYCALACL